MLRSVAAYSGIAIAGVMVAAILPPGQGAAWRSKHRHAESPIEQGLSVDAQTNALHDRVMFSHGRKYTFLASVDPQTNAQRAASIFVGTKVMQKPDRTCEKLVTTLVATDVVLAGDYRMRLPVTQTTKSDVDCPV